jgi:2'-5' RNA ligase
VSKRLVIAYWLIPAEPERSFFQRLINDLAQQHDAPLFEPHVTIFVGANHVPAAERALSEAARYCRSIKLEAIGIDHSGEFIKTLFVQFAPSTELRRLNKMIRSAAQDSSDYELKPHLSLLYKKVSPEVRRHLASSIKLPFSKIEFDVLKVIRCLSPTQTTVDVEAWRAIATKPVSHT